jgi:tetratricopeptide (TPR) repeat protein
METQKYNKMRVLMMCDEKVKEYEAVVAAKLDALHEEAKAACEEYLRYLEVKKEELIQRMEARSAVQKLGTAGFDDMLSDINAKIDVCKTYGTFQNEEEQIKKRMKSRQDGFVKQIEGYKKERFPYDDGENEFYEDPEMAKEPIPNGDDIEEIFQEGIDLIEKQLEKLKRDEDDALVKGVQSVYERLQTNIKILIGAGIVVLFLFFLGINSNVIQPARKYKQAVKAMEQKEFDDAMTKLEELGDYKDAAAKKDEAFIQKGVQMIEEERWDEAVEYFKAVQEYQSTYEKSQEMIKEAKYQKALSYEKSGKTQDALSLFNQVGDYKDAPDKVWGSKYKYVLENKDPDDKTTYKYLKELKANKYKDADRIYSELYQLAGTVVVNAKSYDTTTHQTSVPYNQPLYVHILLTGGVPGEKNSVTYTIKEGLTTDKTGTLSIKSGSNGYIYWQRGHSSTYQGDKTVVVEFKDDSGKLLGSATIQITR